MEESKKVTKNETTPVRKNILHIFPSKNKWSVRAESVSRARRICNTKDDALKYAHQYTSKGWTIVVHKKDGTVEYIIDANGSKL